MSQATQSPPRILLLQSRHPDDIMLDHERRCIHEHLGTGITLHTHNAISSPFPSQELSDFAGVVFGGSGDCSVIDPANQRWVTPLLRVVEHALTIELPGFGLCFGHQLLAKALGAPIATAQDRSESGTVDMHLTPEGQNDPLFGALSSPFRAHTGHSDSVLEIPIGVTLLAYNNRLPTQAFRVNDAPFVSTQFHPDLTGAQAHERYQAYQLLLPRPIGKPNQEVFALKEDQATGILSRFGEWVLQRENGGTASPPVA